MMLRTYFVSIAFLSSAFFPLPSPVRAGLVSSLSVDITSVDGQFEYSYSLVNHQNSTLSVIDMSIDVDVAASLLSITSPTGWIASYNDGDSFISWQSNDVPFDLQPGSTDVFAFKSVLPPAMRNFSVLGIDENSSDFDFNGGLIDSPTSAVPEPSSILHLLTATLAGLFAFVRSSPSFLSLKKRRLACAP